jgi:hypothetical protein
MSRGGYARGRFRCSLRSQGSWSPHIIAAHPPERASPSSGDERDHPSELVRPHRVVPPYFSDATGQPRFLLRAAFRKVPTTAESLANSCGRSGCRLDRGRAPMPPRVHQHPGRTNPMQRAVMGSLAAGILVSLLLETALDSGEGVRRVRKRERASTIPGSSPRSGSTPRNLGSSTSRPDRRTRRPEDSIRNTGKRARTRTDRVHLDRIRGGRRTHGACRPRLDDRPRTRDQPLLAPGRAR